MSPTKNVRSYDDVAAGAQVRRCRGILKSGHYCHKDHRKGAWEPGVVHWSDRRTTKPGVRRFLYLAAFASDPDLDQRPRWEKVWLANRYIDTTSRSLQVRVPHGLSGLDRAIVRSSIVHISPDVPGREEARKWSSR